MVIGLNGDALGRTCGLDAFGFHAPAFTVEAACLNVARLINSCPAEVAILWHGLASKVLAIDNEFHFGAIGVSPDVNLFALVSL